MKRACASRSLTSRPARANGTRSSIVCNVSRNVTDVMLRCRNVACAVACERYVPISHVEQEKTRISMETFRAATVHKVYGRQRHIAGDQTGAGLRASLKTLAQAWAHAREHQKVLLLYQAHFAG